MKFSQFEKLVPMLYSRHAAVHLIGAPGCGKSYWIENRLPEIIRETLGVEINVRTTMLTAYEACDIAGFKVPAKVEGVMSTVSTKPEFIPDVEEGEGIMFWDERSQAQPDVQKAIAPIILSNRAGVFDIPAGWRQWSASNRLKDKSGVAKPPMHLINRERTFHIEPDVASWRDNFAVRKGYHPLAIGYAKFKEGAFNAEVPAEPVPFLTLRSYSAAWEDLTMYVGGNDGVHQGLSQDVMVMEILQSSVGSAAATEIMAYLKIAAELRTWDEIMSDPTGVKVPAGRYDVAYAYMGMVLTNVNASNGAEAFKFITTAMPKELQVATIKGAVEASKGSILNHPDFAKYVRENAALITASVM